ncbi:uncharacterized protein LOC110460295 isoform X2 [Mizuhopecten yessoensis]|uniref:uncharacterized protein LOC110460295 isoform X2 n=1 Tax=Mizuhopecten yessoensis TaxID=6573 RepID=UPI000B45A50F|nr:uncharacterized protein LOC110460295 isoform X2 [Mizuhopecten yessoensis]
MDSSDRPVMTALSIVPIMSVTKYPEIVVHADLAILVIPATQAARPIVKGIYVIRPVGYVQNVHPGFMALTVSRLVRHTVDTHYVPEVAGIVQWYL